MGTQYTGATGAYATTIAELRSTIETQALVIKGLRMTVRDLQVQIGDKDRRLNVVQAALARQTTRKKPKSKQRG